MNNHEEFFELCEEHTERARERHPGFCGVVAHSLPTLEMALESARDWNSNDETLSSLLDEEVTEFTIEAKKGNKERAREEAADIVALLLRYLDGDLKEAPGV